MSRIHDKRGFSLSEAMIAVGVIGCIVACVILIANSSNLSNSTIATRQAKIESALKSATMSIVGTGEKIGVATACNPVAMRDLYLSKLTNAQAIDNVDVNGQSYPALKLENYGVIVFENAQNCSDTWNSTNVDNLSSGGVVIAGGTENANNDNNNENNVSANVDNENVNNQNISQENQESAENSAFANNGNVAPVTIYATLDDKATSIQVPANVTSNASTDLNANSTGKYTSNTMAFGVASSGITNTYSNITTSTNTTVGTTYIAATTSTSLPSNSEANSCKQGTDYSYISSTCINQAGEPVSINFYEMLNEISCQVSYCPGNGYDKNQNLITSGQINMLCKTGDGNVGQCSCPAGKQYYVSRYKIANSNIRGICTADCSEFGMVAVSANQCDCPDGTTWNTTVQKCVTPNSCDKDYLKWDPTSASCVCKSATELLEMDRYYFSSCEVYDATRINDGCKKLKPNWNKTNGTCVCPIPFTQVGLDCTCQAPRIINQQGECVCDFDKVRPTLAEDEIFDNDDYNPTCKIKCDSANYYFPNTTQEECVQILPECGCLEELSMNDYQCYCKSDITDAQLRACGVADYEYSVNTGSCKALCPGGQVRDTQDVTQCVCLATKPADIVLNQYEKWDVTAETCRSCDTVNTNRVYEFPGEGNCICKSKNEMTFDGEEVYSTNSANCKFDCATIGKIANADRTDCINPLPVCNCLEVLVNGVCVCNENITTEELRACSALNKQEGYVFDATSATCQTKCNGTSRPAESLKGCACDCLKIYNGSECVCDPNQSNNDKCINDDEVYDDTSVTCKTCKEPNREYDANGVCACKPQNELTLAANEIYDITKQSCIYTCKDGAVANSTHTECIGGCLEEYNYETEQLQCIQNPTDEKTKECLEGTNFVSDPSAETCKVECSELTSPNEVHKLCPCDQAKVAVALSQTGNLHKIYDLNNAPVCMMACGGETFPTEDRTQCRLPDCLYTTTDNITQHCNPNPSQEEINRCVTGNNISKPSEVGCVAPCEGLTAPNVTRKACACDQAKVAVALTQTGNLHKIYDLDNAPACMKPCTGNTFPEQDRLSCRQPDCLYETTDNITQHCIPNPTDEKTQFCLAGTNDISNPNASDCRETCGDRRTANQIHKVCECDINKMNGKYSSDNMKFDAASATCESACPLNQKRDPLNPNRCICKSLDGIVLGPNEIYYPTALTCKYECKNGAVANAAHTECIGGCLEEYNYETEQLQCIQNPSDEITKKCLMGTNFVSDPSAETCKVECSKLTSPNEVHKLCPCDQAKVAVALTQTGNLHKIYDLDNAPACMKPCTGNTFPEQDRLSCRQPDCLYETTDNITQHCIPNPTDEKTQFCLAGTNDISNPNASDCRETCGDRRTANQIHKVCECDINKMNGKYSSDNMKFDVASATCESACPSSFTIRSNNNPAICMCPTTKPSAVTIQAGYYYEQNSSILTGATACQLQCPKTGAAINNWIKTHQNEFKNNKMVYDSSKVGCIGECKGTYVASADKTSCICGINANSCAAGTYYDAASCSCVVCPAGSYCPGKTTQPIKCPCGTYGSTTGLKTEACSGTCRAGYYCPAGSTSATQVSCGDGYICHDGACTPQPCAFPSTSTSPYLACNTCLSESQIRQLSPSYIGSDEVYVNDLHQGCKKCKSNMIYDSQGACVCPADKPYWNGNSCQACQLWGTLYIARQEKNNPSCTLYNHMMGSQAGGCFADAARVVPEGMKKAASLLSGADKNRNFGNGIYAYIVSVAPDGKSASVVGVFTARSWYNIFPADYSSYTVKKADQAAGSCSAMCNNNGECVQTCNYFYNNIKNNSMFTSCKYAIANQYLGQTFNNAYDELCQGGQIVMENSCKYNVGGFIRRAVSPLVLDLKGDGLEFTPVEEGVVFDLDNDGMAELSAWTTPQTEFDNAFLVLDKNKNGQVDNGGELFGDQNGEENGFKELAKYDDNKDDVITKEDDVFKKLLLWVDFNKNGKVDYDENDNTVELKTLDEVGVTEISTLYKTEVDSQGNILKDIYGNITGLVGNFKMMIEDAAGKLVEVVRTMIDVFFQTIQGA